MNPRFFSKVSLATFIGCVAGAITAAEPRVDARIEIPEAEVYVLGDDIPIIWEFINRSPSSVAMLWEGCCRLNGKLNITSGGEPVAVLPPGAASFHSYTRAEELKTDVPGRFSSLLSDWVRLPAGGDYQIGGDYTGVLPSQMPQVDEGLALWRGTTTASPQRLSVISVDEYLSQRDFRSADRGWKLSLSGPSSLPPLDSLSVKVQVKNLSSVARQFAWPGPVQLWVVDSGGIRLVKATKQIRVPGEEIVIEPGAVLERRVDFGADDLNGGPFGRYQVFVDLAATETEGPRVPSNALSVDWELPVGELVKLLNEAGGGPSIGMRNPALKLLRVYLGELKPKLQRLPDNMLNPKGVELRDELLLAGCLQPLSPKPGRAVMTVQIGSGAPPHLKLPDGIDCGQLDDADALNQLRAIYSIRRHLGWDIAAEVEALPDTPLSRVFGFVNETQNRGLKLSGPLTLSLVSEPGRTNVVQFVAGPSESNRVARLGGGANVVARFKNGLQLAAKKPVPGRPIWMNGFRGDEAFSAETTPVDHGRLAEWIEARSIETPRVVVIVDGTEPWSQLEAGLAPLWEITSRVSIARDPN